MKIMKLLYEILSEGKPQYVSPTFISNFPKEFKKYLKANRDQIDAEISKKINKKTAGSDWLDMTVQERNKLFIKMFVEKALEKVKIKVPDKLIIKIETSTSDPNLYTVFSPKISGKIYTVKDSESNNIKSIDSDKSELQYREKKDTLNIMLPANSDKELYKIYTGYKGADDEEGDEEIDAEKSATKKPKDKKGKVDTNPYVVRKTWDLQFFDKLPKVRTLANDFTAAQNTLKTVTDALVKFMTEKGTIAPGEMNSITTEVKLENIKDPQGKVKYKIKKGDLEIETFIDMNNYELDRNKTTIRFRGTAIYPL